MQAKDAMPIRLVFDWPRRHTARRLRQAMGRLAGGIFVAIGLMSSVVAIPTSFVVAGMVAGWLAEEPFVPPDMAVGAILLAWAISTSLSFAGLRLGLRLVRGERRLVLFLRRFGYDEATLAVTYAATSTIGGSWRLVTLDDAEIAPVGVSAGTRHLFIIGRVFVSTAMRLGRLMIQAFPVAIWSLLAIALIDLSLAALKVESLAAVPWAKVIDPYLYIFKEILELRLPFHAVSLTLPGAFAAVAIVAALSFGGLIVVFVSALTAIPLGAVLAFVSSSDEAVRKAEQSKSMQIGNEAQIDSAARAIGANSRKVFGPRLAVLRVASGVWPQAVTRLASLSSVALIDVSEPTENLLWEIDTLAPTFGARCVLIGHHDRIAHLATLPAGAAASRTCEDRLLTALEGREVLVYTTDRRGMRRFARALRARLHSAAD